MKPVFFEGERLTRDQIDASRKLIRDIATECAGQFFDENRSDRFRAIWGSSDEAQRIFAESQWTNFVIHARAFCAAQLNNEKLSDQDKERYHRALIVEATLGTRRGAKALPIQIEPGTPQFEGEDRRYIGNLFADQPVTLRERMARFRSAAAYLSSKLH